MVRLLVVAAFLLSTSSVLADVPVTGRSQHMLFSRAAVQAAASKAYHQKLVHFASLHELDNDKATLERVRRISSRLIAQAVFLKPEAADWPWEVHITSDPEVAAFSMAGGKLLVGTHFIQAYHLNDDELGVVLAHEIGHVIAEHVREQISMAAEFDPPPPGRTLKVADVINEMNSDIAVYLQLMPLSRLQETEADDIGVELAARSGIPPVEIKRFYAKITRAGTRQSLFDTHGSSRQRAAFASSMANYAEPEYEASLKSRLPDYVFGSNF
ncbi:MAG: M48 family metallopeptidase [Gammaproteobacteria bacterium]